MKKYGIVALLLMSVFVIHSTSYALPTQVINLGDTTIEMLQTGYTGNSRLENLEYWFMQNGITNPDGSAIDALADQNQDELFYTDVARSYQVEFLGIGFASFHSPFGVFTYEGDPYGTFDAANITYYDALFVQNEVEDNSTYDFTIEADTFFGFYLNSYGGGTYLTTMLANNKNPSSNSRVKNKSDYTLGYDNAVFFETNKGYTIAFEDIAGGGDADHEDLVVNFMPTDESGFDSASPVPEPSTLLLLGFGLLGIVHFGRRNRQ